MDELANNTETRRQNRFNIVSPQERDSMGSENWRNFLNAYRLAKAWKPAEGSPYTSFMKLGVINAIDQIGPEIKPRFSKEDKKCFDEFPNLLYSGVLGPETAVILDSGGAHSVAMSTRLVTEKGYQPVIMLDNKPMPNGFVRSEQSLASLLYFASLVEMVNESNLVKPDSPPVFVLETHRKDPADIASRVDNSKRIGNKDFPTAEFFIKHGIKKVVYVTEADKKGLIDPGYKIPEVALFDLREIFREWKRGGIEILFTGISPIENNAEKFSNNKTKSIKTGSADTDLPVFERFSKPITKNPEYTVKLGPEYSDLLSKLGQEKK